MSGKVLEFLMKRVNERFCIKMLIYGLIRGFIYVDSTAVEIGPSELRTHLSPFPIAKEKNIKIFQRE